MKKYVLIFILLVIFPFHAWSATYYVTQSGAGARSGSSYGNSMSVSSHNSGRFSPGDIIYLCDRIASQVTAPSSGSALGGYITYRGDYAGHAGVIDRNFASSSDCFNTNGKDYIVIDGIEMTQATAGGILMYKGSDHIIIKNCEIHHIYASGDDSDSKGINADDSCSYITIGGAPGNGNSVHHIGKGTGSGDIDFVGTDDVIVSYNTLWSDGTDYGIDGIVIS